MDVIQAVKNVQQNDSEAARDRLRDVLDEAGNIHQRYQLEGAAWMHAAAHILDENVSGWNRHYYRDILEILQQQKNK